MLRALAPAPRLTAAERDHPHHLAGAARPAPSGPPREVRGSTIDLIERLRGVAAVVTSAVFDVLAWNDLACALMEDFPAVPPRERNFARRAFLPPAPGTSPLYGLSDLDDFRVHAAHELRAAGARYPGDESVAELIGGGSGRSTGLAVGMEARCAGAIPPRSRGSPSLVPGGPEGEGYGQVTVPSPPNFEDPPTVTGKGSWCLVLWAAPASIRSSASLTVPAHLTASRAAARTNPRLTNSLICERTRPKT